MSNKIIVKIKAGLGNQMFQYACGRAMAMRTGGALKLDVSDWAHDREKVRSYLLGSFDIAGSVATDEEIKEMIYPHGEFMARARRKMVSILRIHGSKNRIIKRHGDIYLDGFWQSENYFLDQAGQIRKDFKLKNAFGTAAEGISKQISGGPTAVSVHIRRGDNAHSPSSMKSFGCPGIDYYSSAIDKLTAEIGPLKLFIFSDEIEWARENLRTDHETVFVSQDCIDPCEEIALMSLCKHHVISNSTFGWWGAWLNANPDKIVVAPRRWALQNIQEYKDIIPAGWIRI